MYKEQKNFWRVINMTKEKNINTSAAKDKFADELLTDDELDNVAGGTGGTPFHHDNKNSGGKPGHCH